MNLVELSPGGPRLSPIVAGAWRLAAWGWSMQERLRWIEQCMELGVTSFDHADIYGAYSAESLFGEALAVKPSLREHMQLVGKVGIKLVAPRRPEHRVQFELLNDRFPLVTNQDRAASAAPRAIARRHARSMPAPAHPADDLVAAGRRCAFHRRRRCVAARAKRDRPRSALIGP